MLLTHFQKDCTEAGCDEAGRGCLAGPVVAAAVILPEGWNHPLLNDSKKLSATARNKLRQIIEREALAWAVGIMGVDIIERINILHASIAAMHQALDQLSLVPQGIIVDGNRFKSWQGVPHQCIVKGDGKYTGIAAASILAKTHRDALMESLHESYPAYHWNRNKGYPTSAHREAIALYGPTPHHRMGFSLLRKQAALHFAEACQEA